MASSTGFDERLDAAFASIVESSQRIAVVVAEQAASAVSRAAELVEAAPADAAFPDFADFFDFWPEQSGGRHAAPQADAPPADEAPAASADAADAATDAASEPVEALWQAVEVVALGIGDFLAGVMEAMAQKPESDAK